MNLRHLKYVDVNNVIKQNLVNLILRYIWVWDLKNVTVNNAIIEALKMLSCDIYECKRLGEIDGTCEQCDKTKSCKSYLAIHVNIDN